MKGTLVSRSRKRQHVQLKSKRHKKHRHLYGLIPQPPNNIFMPTVEETETISEIARRIREGNLVMLIGGGVSIPAGLPRWGDLILRVAEADDTLNHSFKQVSAALGDDLPTIASYLRNRNMDAYGRDQWYSIIHQALYSHFLEDNFIPIPSIEQRLIVAISSSATMEVWTTNYDDLLERAYAETEAVTTVPLAVFDPSNRSVKSLPAYKIHHLHGFLPFNEEHLVSEWEIGSPVLSSDDYVGYQSIPSIPDGWVQSGFLSLFDSRCVLILGMSLRDPNLRNALAYTNNGTGTGTADYLHTGKHVALLADPDPSQRTPGQASRMQKILAEHWQQYDVSIQGVPSRNHVAAYLSRIHIELIGSKLWEQSYRRASRIWEHPMTEQVLAALLPPFAPDFSNDFLEVDDVGICILRKSDDGGMLVKKYYSVKDGRREGKGWKADLGDFSGTAGICFTQCQNLYTTVNQAEFDFKEHRGRPKTFNLLCAVPLIDWKKGGLRVGVLYASLRVNEQVLVYLEDDNLLPKTSMLETQIRETKDLIDRVLSQLTLTGNDLLRRV